MNRWLRTPIVAPMTSSAKNYPSRVPIRFDGKDGQIALDEIRTIDRSRLIRRFGTAGADTAMALSEVLVEMFRFGEG